MSTPISWLRGVIPAPTRPVLKHAAYAGRGLRYAGDAVERPVCGGRSSRFLPNPGDGRPGARCPRGDTCERHRLLTLYLKRHTDWYTRRPKVLDFAPMFPMLKAFKAMPNLDYTTAGPMLEWIDVKVDITDIQYEARTFDAMLCFHVIERVPDDRKALAELYRILKPGGWANTQVPVDFHREETLEDPSVRTPPDRLRVYGHHDHKRRYGKDFKARLEEAGCQVDVRPFANTFSEAEQQRFVPRTSSPLIDDVHMFHSRKEA